MSSDKEKETAELLRCAADHIDRVGMVKGTYYKGLDYDPYIDMPSMEVLKIGKGEFADAPCCAYGALYACASDLDQVTDAALAARMVGYRIYKLDVWNDTPRRRKGDVVKLFRKAAERLDPA